MCKGSAFCGNSKRLDRFFSIFFNFSSKAGVCLCWRLFAFGFGGRLPLFQWRAVVGWLCPDAFRRRGRTERLAIFPFLYAISTLEKLFNLSASLCFSLSIRGKVAEGFDFQTFQHCSAMNASPQPQGMEKIVLRLKNQSAELKNRKAGQKEGHPSRGGDKRGTRG